MKMLQHLNEQPLYITLKNYKLIGLVAFFSILYLVWDIWTWIQDNHTEASIEVMGGIFALLMALIPTFKWTISYIGDKSERED